MNDHIEIRALKESDLGLVRRWRNSPEVRFSMYRQHLISESEHRQWFERSIADASRHLLLVEQDETPFGFVNFKVVDPQARRAEWGFYLSPQAEKGYGRLLGKTAIGYAFDILEFNKLCGEVLAHNTRSQAFHRRLGFQQEACLRAHHFDGQRFHDVFGYGLLRSEWQEHSEGSVT